MAQRAAAVMEPGSSIVNISSVLGITTAGLPQAAYSASKAGLLGLTRDLAQQWTGRHGIRVNAVAPGYFGSELTTSTRTDTSRARSTSVCLRAAPVIPMSWPLPWCFWPATPRPT
jgi:NAD(P)-dependent dehydrogenase (short-subunit alcohol dehydrogenase family)